MKQLIKNYNNESTIVALTSYPNPPSGKYGHRNFNAVAEFSEKTLAHIASISPVLVLAEDTKSVSSFRVNKNLTVVRVWKKGSTRSFWEIFKLMRQLPRVTSFYVQFEFNVFGGILPNLAMVALLAALKVMGKHITFEMHQVITDVGLLKKHVPLGNRLIELFYNYSLQWFYRLIGLVSTHVIVFEEELRYRLADFIPFHKIHLLSLLVNLKTTPDKKRARALVNRSLRSLAGQNKTKTLKAADFVLLVFGYINGYKGIDWITEVMGTITDPHIKLVIAGGPNPYLQDKPFYKRFYKSIITEAKKHDNIMLTGFVPDEKVHEYFGAADLVVMPYDVFMSASGPFSQALSYAKPILLSDKLSRYSLSYDFKTAMKKAHLKQADLFFPRTTAEFVTRLTRFQKDTTYKHSLELFVKTLRKNRSSKVVTAQYKALLLPPAHPATLKLRLETIDTATRTVVASMRKYLAWPQKAAQAA